MPVRKRGNTWSWYFDMAKINGKRQRKEKGGYKTKAEAEKALAKAKEEYEACGKITFETEMSMSDFMDYFYNNYSLIKLKYYTYIFISILVYSYISKISTTNQLSFFVITLNNYIKFNFFFVII